MHTSSDNPVHPTSPGAAEHLASVQAQYMKGRSVWSHLFNLNDPRWGRDAAGQEEASPASEEGAEHDPVLPPPVRPSQPGSRKPAEPEGPPDLDEVWREFNRKLGNWFGGNGGKGGHRGSGQPSFGGGGRRPPDMKAAGISIGLAATVLLLVWGVTGFFIVQEGQQSVVTRFGQYRSTVGAGINWRLPYPIERHETVNVTQIRSVDIGGDSIVKSTGLRDSAMLTADENIVEIKFAVQYRLNNARDFLFASRDPEQAVKQAAETAIREVIGGMRMDAALAEERDQIAPRVARLMQTILDRYKIGVEVVGINLQQGGVRPPEQVQAAFDDVLKAGQERARAQNEAQAYANRVIPLAKGTAARLAEDAQAYKARVIAQAQGDADRFNAILPEYQKAPQATRDRMYNDTMQEIYSKVTKIMVDTRQGSMLYLPLDKILQNTSAQAAQEAATAATPLQKSGAGSSASTAPAASNTVPAPVADTRSRQVDVARSRVTP